MHTIARSHGFSLTRLTSSILVALSHEHRFMFDGCSEGGLRDILLCPTFWIFLKHLFLSFLPVFNKQNPVQKALSGLRRARRKCLGKVTTGTLETIVQVGETLVGRIAGTVTLLAHVGVLTLVALLEVGVAGATASRATTAIGVKARASDIPALPRMCARKSYTWRPPAVLWCMLVLWHLHLNHTG